MRQLWKRNISVRPEFEPHSVIKVISKLKVNENSHDEKISKKNSSEKKIARENIPENINEMGIQMISRHLFNQIFKKTNNTKIGSEYIDKYRKELERHGIKNIENVQVEDVKLNLPKLRGENIEEHFQIIAKEQVEPYQKLVSQIVNSTLPEMPKEWSFTPGWTRYDPVKGPQSILHPEETALVFDVEVLVPVSQAPVIACAVGSKYWYSWTSKKLTNPSRHDTKNKKVSTEDMIPLESNSEDVSFNLSEKFRTPRIIIGHNVSYDRARIKEQYWIENTATRFLDTMSLHVCVSGITSYQRAMLKAHKELSEDDQMWGSLTSLNSLTEVHNLYCQKEERLSKERRNIFMEGTMKDIRDDFQNLMNYCANDVVATNEVIKKLFPMFEERFPHPATLAGMLELGTAYLPVNSNWTRYINEANLTYEDFDIESKTLLSQRADNACRLMHNEKYKQDLWMWDQDWSQQDLKLRKGKPTVKDSQDTKINSSDEMENLSKKFEKIMNKMFLLPARRTLLPGYPLWYRKLCEKPNDDNEWKPGPVDIGTGMQVAPKLLSLCWEGYPLHYIRGEGWGFLVPNKSERPDNEDGKIPLEALVKKCPVLGVKNKASENESSEAMANLWKNVEENLSKKSYYNKKKKKNYEDFVRERYCGSGVWCDIELENCCWFFKLPHKDGKSKNVGNPLAKDFINKFSENVLSGEGKIPERIIEIARMLSYWRNNRDRIMGQIVCWLPSSILPKHLANSEMEYGAIIPQVVVCGTLTRRAMEPTWMTASNSKLERVGSELRGMVQAPAGYKIVGADVDSQELWIASVLGDSGMKIHGATPFGWMTLSGSKSTGTDLHTITAKAIGISRDHAKVINYARIYGAGQNFAQTLLKQFNPSISESEAKSKAIKMFSLTKGKKLYHLLPEYHDDYPNKGYSSYEALQISSINRKNVLEMFTKAQWSGGSESAMFNKLEEIADSELPVTPFLHGRLSRALEPQTGIEDRFLPTKINWVVQSGAVDFLHLMLVCMRWLMGDRIKFCLSFHDEVRYIVKDEFADRAALAMHVTNLLTRSFCVSRLGLQDLPQSIAFFTSVEIDSILRKEAESDCKTPSNQHGFSAGYSIKPGESVDIYEAIKRAGDDLSSWEWHKN
ncbi:CLUMA_CG013106, isoform A [Clunio marinus]|uniref:DNA polymerase subunit gamma-1 n=1 Tax=Clunio marinus TaxID=568069 RepID=A0A1J1IL40_9DIPT|nr:CLUMA_CG013106, isoform A [Clunio marinus]